MISKENFIRYINELKEMNDAQRELNSIVQKFGSDNNLCFDEYEILVVQLLQDIFKDEENDWIGYALYELDWFREYKDGMIKDENGSDVPLSNAGDLYDLLVKNIKDMKDNDIESKVDKNVSV